VQRIHKNTVISWPPSSCPSFPICINIPLHLAKNLTQVAFSNISYAQRTWRSVILDIFPIYSWTHALWHMQNSTSAWMAVLMSVNI